MADVVELRTKPKKRPEGDGAKSMRMRSQYWLIDRMLRQVRREERHLLRWREELREELERLHSEP